MFDYPTADGLVAYILSELPPIPKAEVIEPTEVKPATVTDLPSEMPVVKPSAFEAPDPDEGEQSALQCTRLLHTICL